LRAHVLFVLYLVVAVAAIVYPGPRLLPAGTRPYLLGLPLPLGWTVCWIGATFVVLWLYYRATAAKD